jgi:putative nucleotidyltransferase with HDIG domain
MTATPGEPRDELGADHRADQILALLESADRADYIGEGVSQLAHALQAADLARRAGADDEAVLAALLHDIGHLCSGSDAPRMEGVGVARHEEIGAAYLERLGLPLRVTELVRGHVAAKRYLVARDARYLARLSEASRATLMHQGGQMSPAEQHLFESLPHHEDLLRLRSWDESAKDPRRSTPDLASYRGLLRSRLTGTRARSRARVVCDSTASGEGAGTPGAAPLEPSFLLWTLSG